MSITPEDREFPGSDMTLRDYLAGQVLPILLNRELKSGSTIEGALSVSRFARDAYAVADAMMEARKA